MTGWFAILDCSPILMPTPAKLKQTNLLSFIKKDGENANEY